MSRLTATLALLALVPMAGCTPKEEGAAAATPTEARSRSPAAAPAPSAASPAPQAAPQAPRVPRPLDLPGSIRGEVRFAGPAPASPAPDMSSDPACAKRKKGSRPVGEEVVVTGGKLASVFVRLTGNVPAGAPVPTTPVVVDQKGCTFRPRVQGAMAGQTVQVRNGDGTLHNVHSYTGTRTLFNRAQPPGARPMDTSFTDGADVVKLKCDIHPWMLGWVLVVPHPYFATTGRDGSFDLEGVPPGTYTLEAWHERFGTKKTQVKVEPNKPAQVRFTFSAADRG